MAALSLTAANVIGQSGYKLGNGTAGETITRGMPVYLSSANNRLYKCDANLTAGAAQAVGLAAEDSSVGCALSYFRPPSRVAFGAILTVGMIYVAGAGTAGDINPASDLTSGWFTMILGYAETTSILNMSCFCYTGVAP